MPIARCSKYGQVLVCPSFEGLLVFKGKKLHNDKFSSLEGSNRAKSKLEQMQRRSAIVQGVRRDPRMYAEIDRRARGFNLHMIRIRT